MRLEKVWKIYLWIGFAGVLLAFNPLLVDNFGLGKQSYMIMVGLLGLLGWAILLINQKDKKIAWHPFLNWWLLMMVVSILSLIGKPVGVVAKSLYYPWGVGTLFGLGLWWFLGLQAGITWLKKMVDMWMWLAVFLSILSLVIFILPENIWSVTWPNSNLVWPNLSSSFSFLGSLQAEVLFLIGLIIVAIQRWWASYKNGGGYIKQGILLIFLMLGIIAGTYRLSKMPVGWLGLKDSWVVGIQTLTQNPFLGMGVGNFVEGFWKYRSTSAASDANWVSVYAGSLFGWLTWMVEAGILGMLVLILGLWWVAAYRRHSSFGWLLLGLVVLGWAGPWFWLVQLLAGILIMGYGSNKLIHHNFELLVGEEKKNVSAWLVFAMSVIIVIIASWWLAKPIMAEYNWRLGLKAMTKNDPNGAYNWQQKAAIADPQLAEIRRSYAQTNFALAQAIMQNLANNKDKTVVDTDKQNLSVLLGQAIDEAKAAIALEPNNPNMWGVLGLFYKNMVGTVDGSYDWAVQAYQQMAHLDPANPFTRIELGGMFFGAGDMETAAKIFEEAVKIKPDLPNAWYNLAHATYAQSQRMGKESVARINKLQQAINYLQQAIKLVSVDSQDFEKANKELSDWNNELTILSKPNITPTVTPILSPN